jgi:hyperosmotically inducible periplasmic protein
MNPNIARAVLTLLVALALAHPAAAQDRGDRLVSAVNRSLTTYTRYTVFDDVRTHVEGSAVTLTGKVTAPAKKEELGRRIAALEGVTLVRNDISVLAASPADDELRRRVARAIYANSAFWRYAAMVTPPIRILVERGRVTLTGVVESETDRMLARSLATGLGEVSLSCELTVDR